MFNQFVVMMKKFKFSSRRLCSITRRLLFLLALVLMTSTAWAAPVDALRAQQMAQNFAVSMTGNTRLLASPASMRLAHAELCGTKSSQVAYYVFNTDDSFVIIAGDDRAVEVLGYGDGQLDVNNIPCGMRAMLNQYKEQIGFLHSHPKLAVEKVASASASLKATARLDTLKTKWGQRSPYNNHCPVWNISYGSDTLNIPAPTGCVATALSQIMYYWKYPASFPKINAYSYQLTDTLYNIYISGTVKINSLSASTINWSDMLLNYSGNETTQAKEAVAQLMQYTGQAAEMRYAIRESVTDVSKALNAVKTFGYSAAQLLWKYNYQDDEWNEKILGELSQGRPIFYGATDTAKGGHAFIIDGHDSTGKYHINWGWNGSGNGFFALGAFNVTLDNVEYKFNTHQAMIVGLVSPTLSVDQSQLTFNSSVGVKKTKTFTITGVNLKEAVTLELAGSCFSIDKTTVTAAQATDGVKVTVTYTPTAAATHNGTISIKSSGITKTVTLKGTATALVSPSSLTFSSVVSGLKATKTFTVKSSYLTKNLTLKVNNSAFSISKSTITPAEAKKGVTVTVTFKPTKVGTFSGKVFLTSDEALSTPVILKGTSVKPTITVTPATLTMSGALNTTSSTTFKVKMNSPAGALKLALSGTSYYTLSRSSITAAEAYAGVNVTVYFTPKATGKSLAKVTVSGAEADSKTVSIVGTASTFSPVVKSPSATIDLQWLIDGILSGDPSVINDPAADVNGDGTVNVSDVTHLIDLLLAE